uniref:Piwi domain-containing protein n=1 Tax=Heterorhabditis bacteriophora TaxID=37862 RepID=A0A1I7XEE0_HETBA
MHMYRIKVPDDFCWDPTTKSFGDPSNRPEIRYSTVEFIAPNEYMAVNLYLGYLYTFSEQLLINLDQLPGDDRTQVAFVCVDSSLHFFQFSSGNRRMPRELIMVCFYLLYNIVHYALHILSFRNLSSFKSWTVSSTEKKHRCEFIFAISTFKKIAFITIVFKSIRCFIEKLPVIFEKASSSSNCLGAALNIVQEMIAEVGGRISVFQSSIPNIGPGSLHPREDPNQRAANDVPNLGPATDFYKRLALECTGQQVALDLFMLNSQYSDLATLSEIAKFSTGCVYHFPNYHCLNDVVQVKRFEKILARYLTRKIGFEAVLRIRSSRGLALSAFYGNFFVRSTDLLALANVNPDSAIAVQINLEEKLSTSVCFQAALLYTSSKGDRRIRVHTICLPTTSDLGQVYRGLDLKAAISLLGKLGVDRSMAGAPLSDSREAIVNAVVDSLGAYMRTLGQGRATAVLAPRTGHLRLFPLYALAMLKHVCYLSSVKIPTSFCAGRSIKVDDRVAAMLMLRFCPLEQIMSEIYPQLYRLNEIDQVIYCCLLGFYHSFREYENPLSQRAHIFLKHVTALKFYLGPVIIVREDSALREVFVRRLINDRSESTHSYVEFLQHIKRELGQ